MGLGAHAGEADGVITLGGADIEDAVVVARGHGIEDRDEFGLIAADEFGRQGTAIGGQEVFESLEGSVLDGQAILGDEGLGDTDGAGITVEGLAVAFGESLGAEGPEDAAKYFSGDDAGGIRHRGPPHNDRSYVPRKTG
jgi:hypothetical protein